MPGETNLSYGQLLKRLDRALKPHPAKLIPYGNLLADNRVYPFVRIVFGQGNPRRVLISAGIHGDEPAGVETICCFLERELFAPYQEQWEITLLPCLNPTGYENRTRENHAGKDLNREFKLDAPSLEIKLIQTIFTHPFDLTLELHEDIDTEGYYLYQKECAGRQTGLGHQILERVRSVLPINMNPEIEEMAADRGVIIPSTGPEDAEFWPMALYSNAKKTKSAFTLETPTTTRFSMDQRVTAHLVAVQTALDCFKE